MAAPSASISYKSEGWQWLDIQSLSKEYPR